MRRLRFKVLIDYVEFTEGLYGLLHRFTTQIWLRGSALHRSVQ